MSPRSTGTAPSSGRGEALFRWAFLSALAAVPVAFLPGWRDAWGPPKLVLAGAASLLAAAGLAAARGLGRAASRVDLPLAAFSAAAALSAAASMDPRLSWFGVDRFYLYGFPGWAALTSAFYLGCALRRSSAPAEEAARAAARALCAGALLVGAAALLQWLGWLRLEVWRKADPERPCSTIGNYASLGLYAAMVLPPAFSLWRRPGHDRLLGAAAFLLCACALGLSGSRGALLAAACGGAVAWWMGRSAGGKPAVPPAVWAGIALAVLLGLASLALRSAWRPLTSDDMRMTAWRIAGRVFAEQPWLGSGPGTFGIVFRMRKTEALAHQLPADAHCDWAELLATTGAVGAAAYAWLHWGLLCGVLAARREGDGPALAPLAGAVAALLVFMKFNSPTVAVAWTAAALAGVLLGRPAAPPGTEGLRPGRVLLPACAAALCLLSARAFLGDLHDVLGRNARREGRMAEADEHLRRAVARRPEATAYRYDYDNLLWHASERAEGPEARRALLASAVAVARAGIALRPLDADLYRLLGLAELRRVEAGETDRLAAARGALESARRLDPFYEDALRDLAKVADLQGDVRERRELEAVLARAAAREAGAL